ncbi:ribose ABC transporter permease [Suicoccus acidiformans]|uniref:Ribose ABC transporter permease n=1 Tax=Suicoccus acidiformans TaxID=2036206 RepID=A0A347WIP3_9LACT|nr:ribose ABC transporter permease [Suicoccus acidiformans]AXY24950.1 ribose ABC transporter permease [Suicoccus acidiformans]
MSETSRKRINTQELGAVIALVILVLALAFISPEFRTLDNILNLLRQASTNGLIAFGMTVVILTGGIDLGVGPILALTGALTAGMIVNLGIPVPVAILIALVVGLLLGVVGGVLVGKARLQPFIATLITQTVYRGLTLIYTDGRPISGITSPEYAGANVLEFIGRKTVLGIPTPIIIMAIAFILIYILLNKTSLGRQIYAVGSNEKTAKLSGIDTSKVKVFVYTLSGLMSTIAGLILISRLNSAQPTLGTGYELDAIAATAIGGTSMDGGRGKLTGTLIGVLIIAVLSNGMNILGINSYLQDVVKGLVILFAVLSDRRKQ